MASASNVATTSSEKTSLLEASVDTSLPNLPNDYRVAVDVDGPIDAQRPHRSASVGSQLNDGNPRRSLATLAGVFSPVALSMFSTVLFLRLGFIVGQAGIIQTVIQFFLAYFILYLTILSICAISTNGAVEGGGAYYMISRALGPEFGGSIGFLFFLANILSCGLYVSGFVEGLVGNFGVDGGRLAKFLPESYWWIYLYATGVVFLALIVCLIGGAMFARTSLFILLVLVICTVTVIVSMLGAAPHPKCIPYSPKSPLVIPFHNGTNGTHPCGNFTAINVDTFLSNLDGGYQIDYETTDVMNFAMVFAVLFSSVTGIMNGANMSGELKDPGRSIPRGTLAASTFTLIIYLLLAFLTAASCQRDLLVNNYLFMQQINFHPSFVVIGIFSATFSAALGNLIGASRILEALAKDELFWFLMKPATYTTASGNPVVAVFVSWGLVQLVLLIGSLNTIAPLASVFFLLSYASTNLACLGLGLASAPNFRPTFRYFSWHTCLLGLLGCLVMCFLINAGFTGIGLALSFLLIIILHLRSYPTSWGSISQALIFHQVRKYLLMLDSRKEHVKYWRPQMLLLVSNPRAACDVIDFINDIKKSGLYILGHVKLGDFDGDDVDVCQRDYPNWLSLVDHLKVKAFVEITQASNVREGMRHLLRISGLGGMKPNTVCLGFYDNNNQQDTFYKPRYRKRRVRFYGSEAGEVDTLFENFPPLRTQRHQHSFAIEQYVHMVSDALKMNKNVCLFRHFCNLDKDEIFTSKEPHYIDVWPLNFCQPETAGYLDNASLFLLQLACILHMVPGWKKKTQLRIFLCVESNDEYTKKKERKLSMMLKQLRIMGVIKTVPFDNVVTQMEYSPVDSDDENVDRVYLRVQQPYFRAVNALMKQECDRTAVVFCYLPKPPTDTKLYESFLSKVDLMTEQLPPTVLVHGIHPVTSTTL